MKESSTSIDLKSLSEATQAWCTFDLTSRRTQLTHTVQQSRENREASQSSRKQLAELTKKFKKAIKLSTDSAVSTEGRVTIKAYQDEIDNLTRRYKSSDNEFLSLYQNLFELPDPGRVLSYALEALEKKESEVDQLNKNLKDAVTAKEKALAASTNTPKPEPLVDLLSAEEKKELEVLRKSKDASSEEIASLKREISEYEVEFRSLKNQDITIRKLEAKINELERSKEEDIANAVRKVQEELTETEGRRASEALEREAAAERRLQSLELELKAERAGREHINAHLLQAEDGAGQREAAWEAQRRILIDDAERLRESLHHATTERDELRMKVAAANTNPSPPPSSSSTMYTTADILAERRAYEAEVDELSHTLTTLREQVRGKEDQIASLQSTIEQSKKQNNELSNSVQKLKTELDNAPSHSLVENMKHELRILKRLEYNADEPHDDDDDELENVLLARLRKCEGDLMRERREKQDIQNNLESNQKKLYESEKATNEAQQLISKLELDLQKALEAAPSTKAAFKTTTNQVPGLNAQTDPNLLESILDPSMANSSSALEIPSSTSSGTIEKSSTDQQSSQQSEHTVATILIAQRDRLKSKCDALEAERDSFKKELQLQVSLSDSLKTDNTKLYEKLRFLQNFASRNNTGIGNRSAIASPFTDRDIDLEALEQRYESSVDPFKQFNRSERQRKLKEMSNLEKVVYYAAKTVLANKQMRTALFFYVCTMHLLVFITTYHWAHELNCSDLIIKEGDEVVAHMHGGIPLDESK